MLKHVMVNCIHQLDWANRCPDGRQNIILGCFCEGVFGETGWHLSKQTEWRSPSTTWWLSSHLLRAWVAQKGWKKGEFILSPCAEILSSPTCRHWCFWFSGLWIRMVYITGVPGSQACAQQIMGLLDLHNCVSKFLQ